MSVRSEPVVEAKKQKCPTLGRLELMGRMNRHGVLMGDRNGAWGSLVCIAQGNEY